MSYFSSKIVRFSHSIRESQDQSQNSSTLRYAIIRFYKPKFVEEAPIPAAPIGVLKY